MATLEKQQSDFTPGTFPLTTSEYVGTFIEDTNNEKVPTTFFGGYPGVVNVTTNKTLTEEYMQMLVVATRQASAITITLPDATTNKGQIITITVQGGATGNVLLAGTGSQTINGELINIFLWEGVGTIDLISTGDNYIAKSNFFDIGSNSDGRFKKSTFGCVTMCVFNEESIAISTTDNGGFRSGATSVNYPITLVSATDVCFGGSVIPVTDAFTVVFAPSSTTFFVRSFKAVTSQGVGTRSCSVIIDGRWF